MKALTDEFFLRRQYLRKYNPRHPAKCSLEHKNGSWKRDDELIGWQKRPTRLPVTLRPFIAILSSNKNALPILPKCPPTGCGETNMEGYLTYISEPMREMLEIDEFTRPTFAQIPWFVDVTERFAL